MGYGVGASKCIPETSHARTAMAAISGHATFVVTRALPSLFRLRRPQLISLKVILQEPSKEHAEAHFYQIPQSAPRRFVYPSAK